MTDHTCYNPMSTPRKADTAVLRWGIQSRLGNATESAAAPIMLTLFVAVMYFVHVTH